MKKFVVYLTAGYPSLEDSFYIMDGISELVDAIEIGIPFSDPLADGPIIQMASAYALSKGSKINDIFYETKKLAGKNKTKLYYMTYYNLLFHKGLENFIELSLSSGVTGLIVPDVPLEEIDSLYKLSKAKGIELVMFITPVTDDSRAKKIAVLSTGFLYYVSVTGVTGERKQVNRSALSHIAKLRKLGVKKPLFLGFGISSPEHVREALKVADGVIIGSAIIKEINPNLSKEENLKNVRRKIEWLKQGLS